MSLTIGPWLQPLPLPGIYRTRDIQIPPKKVPNLMVFCVLAKVQIIFWGVWNVRGTYKFMYGTAVRHGCSAGRAKLLQVILPPWLGRKSLLKWQMWTALLEKGQVPTSHFEVNKGFICQGLHSKWPEWSRNINVVYFYNICTYRYISQSKIYLLWFINTSRKPIIHTVSQTMQKWLTNCWWPTSPSRHIGGLTIVASSWLKH